MGIALFKERRLADRRQLSGLLPGRLAFAATNKPITCKPVDVSAHGLGIVASDALREISEGTELVLQLKEAPVRLKVAWVQPDFGKHDQFRFGLVTLDSKDDLEALFMRTGCLR